VLELNHLLFEALEFTMKNTSIEHLIRDLYEGESFFLINDFEYINFFLFLKKLIYIVQYVLECHACGSLKENNEIFTDLSLPIVGVTTLNECLDNFVQKEVCYFFYLFPYLGIFW
jgi:ubiquitin C-terminal hydrolase